MRASPVILLVEDSEDDAFFFRRNLKKAGIEGSFTHMVDGGAAIQHLRETQEKNTLPDIVFLDLKMPVKNGYEVLEWLKEQPFARDMFIVVLSGSNQETDQNRTRALGASGYLVKPATPEFLQVWVSAALRKSQPGTLSAS